jgi:hypothetical protein
MDWHRTHRSQDGKWRIPADSLAWQHIDSTWPYFEVEHCNLRLGLGTDNLNPFGLNSSSYSVWPVALVNYNLPPHMAIKKGHIMLALLIPGKYKLANMDVYLAPHVEELQLLWQGVQMEDMSMVASERVFQLRAILMWTMHDFPGFGQHLLSQRHIYPSHLRRLEKIQGYIYS